MTDFTSHSHVFLGAGHEKNERRTWMVIALCSFMMVAEIVAGLLLGSIALVADGLHAYDGQIHDTDVDERRKNTQQGLERTLALRERLVKRGFDVPRLVLGGTPTFPIHAELDVPGVECSPGTIV